MPPAARPPRPLIAVGRVHWLGLWTLFRREQMRFLRDLADAIGAPLSALLFLLVFAVALGPARAEATGQDLMGFLLPGLVLMTVVLRAAEGAVFSITFDKLEGILSDVLMPPMGPLEIVGAYVLSAILLGLSAGLPVLLVAVLVFDMGLAQPLLALVFAVLACVMLGLTGILVAVLAQRWDHVAAFLSLGLMPATFLSGVFAPVEAMPRWLELLARANPIFYVVDGFRTACIGAASSPLAVNLAVCVAVCAGLCWLCLRVFATGWRVKD